MNLLDVCSMIARCLLDRVNVVLVARSSCIMQRLPTVWHLWMARYYVHCRRLSQSHNFTVPTDTPASS